MNRKTRIVLLFLALLALLGYFYFRRSTHAQNNWSLTASSGVPTGACPSVSADIDVVTGKLFACQSGVWVAVINPPMRGTTGTITGTLLALGSCNTGTATVTGATTSMPAVATPVSDPGTGIVWNAFVSSANTVTVKECALVLSTPNNTAYNVVVNP